MNVTDVATSTAFESVIVNVSPFPSTAETFATLTMASSSLMIVPVAVLLVGDIVTLRPLGLRLPKVAMKVSFASTFESASVMTVIVCDVVPAGNDTIRDETAVKSGSVVVAVTFDVVNLTEVATSTGFVSETVKTTPFPSVAEAFATLKTELSSFVIVPVATLGVPS